MTISENGTVYYYVTNLQGDVVAILNSSGTAVAQYTYDAWGSRVSTSGATVGTYNPLRYRGYVYDIETGLYYLQSRYYNPSIGRFINADAFASTGQGVMGNNMFAYCGNNPANKADYTGQFWSGIWEGFKTVIEEIGEALSSLSPAYASCGGIALADGPLLYGDAVALFGVTLLTIGAVTYGVSQVAQISSISSTKAEEREGAIVVPKKPDRPVIFPVDPNTFNPKNLIKLSKPGTNNGAIISWIDPKTHTAVFRWDENTNKPNGPHYHIYSKGHYYAGDRVPDPYAKIYFPFG